MTDRPSDRELLRRVVANDDAMRDGSHIEHLLPHFDERKAIIDAIRARLAEPEENVALVSIQVLEDFKTAREEIAALRAERNVLVPLLAEAIDALIWCSGSGDFALGGIARTGWENGPATIIKRARAILDRRDREAK